MQVRHAVALALALLGLPGLAAVKPRRDVPTVLTKDEARALRESQERPGVPVARAAFAEGSLELLRPKGGWERLREGARLATGDRIRTGPDATARIEFPWVELLLGARCEVVVRPSVVLSVELLEGRAEQRSEPGAHLIRLRTPEAVVRGAGHVVVRREAESTFLTVLEGQVLLTAGTVTASVEERQGAVVRSGVSPEIGPLPSPPTGLRPGSDPAYFVAGQGTQLAWEGPQREHYVQVLDLVSDDVLVQREVKGRSVSLLVPWEGTFRWRVATRAPSGLEGPPSPSGYFCIVAK